MCFRWYLTTLVQKYATFNGRAHRKEFWCFTLFYLIGYFALLIVDHVLESDYLDGEIGLLSGIFGLIHFLPNVAVFFRRLHDSGRSGWWYLVCLIPIIGFIVFILFGLAGSQEDNKYGKNPHNLKNIN